MSTSRVVALLAILSLATAACSTGRSTSEPVPAHVTGGEAAWPNPTPVAALEGQVALEQGAILPYLVRHGWLELSTDEPAETAARATVVSSRFGGMVQHAKVGDDRAELVLRVPEPRLDEALDSLSMLGKVESRRLSADDVTGEVIDLEARVASLVGVRDRLRGMLEGSSSMTEIMSIERELARVQAQIDAIEGRLRYLRGSATMAELSLSVRRERILGPVGWVIVGIGRALEKLFVIQ